VGGGGGAGAYVVVWVTNNPAIHSFVKRNLFPRWRVQYVATHYWLKVPHYYYAIAPIGKGNLGARGLPSSSFFLRARGGSTQLTSSGEPVMPLNSAHRKPYGTPLPPYPALPTTRPYPLPLCAL
jgi:hypothetical protein